VIVQFPVAETRRPELIQTAANAGLADVDALQSQFERSVFGEKPRYLIPQFTIERESIAVLQIRDRGLIVQRRSAPRKPFE